MTSFGKLGAGLGEFKYLSNVAIDNELVLYVCDRYNNRIQAFII